MDTEKEKLAESLVGKTVRKVALSDDCLIVTFNEATLIAARRSGPGNGEWEVWTEISVNGNKIIDK